ncbi:hypothetical protein BS78_06G212300 [Paspalum vaginatum]|nr:hypothetical protein BS78_06G212300 [Paspalum vaginatum]
MLFAAMGGSKILVVTDQDRGQTPALVYDPRTGALAFGPRMPAELRRGFDAVVVAGGGVLYTFSSPSYDNDETFEEVWGWRPLPRPPPPHDGYEVIAAHAVHPDGRTVFLTTCRGDCPGILRRMYAFDTEQRAWRWHAWALPFEGAGHFDAELDAWVGLHRDGHVCACRVPADDDSGSATQRRVEEKMFCRDHKRHVRASLTCMGAGRFCLLESVVREEVAADDGYDHMSDPEGFVLYVTMFGLKYDNKGEL